MTRWTGAGGRSRSLRRRRSTGLGRWRARPIGLTPPSPRNRVTLARQTDRNGMPVARLGFHPVRQRPGEHRVHQAQAPRDPARRRRPGHPHDRPIRASGRRLRDGQQPGRRGHRQRSPRLGRPQPVRLRRQLIPTRAASPSVSSAHHGSHGWSGRCSLRTRSPTSYRSPTVLRRPNSELAPVKETCRPVKKRRTAQGVDDGRGTCIPDPWTRACRYRWALPHHTSDDSEPSRLPCGPAATRGRARAAAELIDWALLERH